MYKNAQNAIFPTLPRLWKRSTGVQRERCSENGNTTTSESRNGGEVLGVVKHESCGGFVYFEYGIVSYVFDNHQDN